MSGRRTSGAPVGGVGHTSRVARNTGGETTPCHPLEVETRRVVGTVSLKDL